MSRLIRSSILSSSFLLCLLCSRVVDGNQQLASIRVRVKDAINRVEINISNIKTDFERAKKAYNQDKSRLVSVRRNEASSMIERLETQESRAKISCDRKGNKKQKKQCYNAEKRKISKLAIQELTKTSQLLLKLSTELAEDYIHQIQKNINVRLNEQSKQLNREMNNINKYLKKPQFHWKDFKNEIKAIEKVQKKQLAPMQSSTKRFLVKLQNVVYGTMCFEIRGATGKIKTQQDKKKFESLTKSAMEVAAAKQRIDADVVTVRIIKQEFHPARRRVLRAGAKIKEGLLKVGALIGLRCNCKEEEAISDFFVEEI